MRLQMKPLESKYNTNHNKKFWRNRNLELSKPQKHNLYIKCLPTMDEDDPQAYK